MSSAASSFENKIITIAYNGTSVSVPVTFAQGATSILDIIGQAFGGISLADTTIVDSDDNMARLNWAYMRPDIIYHIKPKAAVKRKRRYQVSDKRLGTILDIWGLENASEIFSAEMKPRVPLDNGERATSHEAAVLDPKLWSRRLTTPLLKLAMDMPGMHQQAMGWVAEARRMRQGDEKNRNSGVLEVMPADLVKALKLKHQHVVMIAREASDSVTFAGGLREVIEGLEDEMHVKTFAGGLREGLEMVEEDMKMEDGTTFGGLSMAE